jgi:hypothetical protein
MCAAEHDETKLMDDGNNSNKGTCSYHKTPKLWPYYLTNTVPNLQI